MDVVHIPKGVGSDKLRNDMEGVAAAELTGVFWGKSQAGQPKATLQFTLTEDIEGLEPPTTGEKVLESCSLQPQALWKLNSYYKEVTSQDFPEGDMSVDEFKEMVEGALLGSTWDLDLKIGQDQKGEPRTEIRKATSN